MKTSGLPCRADHDCDRVFTLSSQNSMDALKEAAARRNAHEIEDHGYSHVVPVDPGATPFARSAVRGRRKKSDELTPV